MKKWLKLGFFSTLSLLGFAYWQNNGITITKHIVTKNNLPKEFDGFRVVQVSDLQNKSFGINHNILLKKLEKLQPDIIVITGDLLDRNRTDIDKVMNFIKQARNISEIYFVTGNHEHQSPDNSWEILSKQLLAENVHIMDNKSTKIIKNGESIEILGLRDYSVNRKYEKHLNRLSNKDIFQILLSHRPELYPVYLQYDIDLAFTGHAHGGQVRLPFFGGVFAPNQGLLPPFTEGIHDNNGTTMIISRGLGNSTCPLRVNNRPELILAVLEKG